MDEELFDVWIFIGTFDGGEVHEKVGESLTAEEASYKFRSYTKSTRPAQLMGIINQVIVVDKDDFCCAQWKRGEGIVWPKPDVQH